MRVLLTSHGSTGDIYPILAYGKALLKAGHKATFAVSPLFKQDVLRAGLDYYYLPPDWEQEAYTEFMRKLNRRTNPILQLREIYNGSVPYLSEIVVEIKKALKDHDVLVGSYLFPQYRVIADSVNKPFATFAFCHSSIPTTDLPPSPLPPFKSLPTLIRKIWCKLTWSIADKLLDLAVNPIIARPLKKWGYHPHQGFLTNPAELVLVGVSKSLMSNRGTTDPRFQFTGYNRWQSKEDPEIEQKLLDFCTGEKVPVLTFGSVAFDDTDSIMTRFEKNWPSGQKIIVQAGWSGLSVNNRRPEIFQVGKMSHDQLFKHASCVIHHGGAGTTASVLASGKPHILIPHIGDQFFWGAEMERLGTGIVLPKKKWPEQLQNKIKFLKSNPQITSQSIQLKEILDKEHGPSNAVRILEDFVRRKNLEMKF